MRNTARIRVPWLGWVRTCMKTLHEISLAMRVTCTHSYSCCVSVEPSLLLPNSCTSGTSKREKTTTRIEHTRCGSQTQRQQYSSSSLMYFLLPKEWRTLQKKQPQCHWITCKSERMTGVGPTDTMETADDSWSTWGVVIDKVNMEQY